MDPHSPEYDATPDEHISSLINEYFDRKQAGEALTPEGFAAEYPECADQLEPYLAGLALIEDARTQVGPALAAKETAGTPKQLPEIAGYKLIEEIDRGGMGVVYKATQVSTKRVVALKVMLVGPFASPSALHRFDREVELAARLQHPGIVGVLESGQVAEQKYYAMDYVEGVRLDRYLADVQPDVRTVLSVFERVCEAVDYAHCHGVIHRDLKPANVLINNEGNPHILDFGLAKATDQSASKEALTAGVSAPGQVMGTLFYLSPEQAAGTPDEIDARTDVYALGVMLFEALTSTFPFDTSGRPSQIIQRILETQPASPSSLSNRVDGELATIILKALEKEKDRRYQSAKEMAEDIRRYLEGEPILAKRPSSLYFLRKKVLKHRYAAGLAALAVVLSLIAVWSGIRWRQQDLARTRWEILQCQRRIEGGDSMYALSAAETLRKRSPQLSEALLVWSQVEYRSHGLGAAMLNLERATHDRHTAWPYWALLAELYRLSGEVERANTLEARVEGEAPDTAEAWYLRSFATLKPHYAVQCAREATELQPTHALAWARLAWLYRQSGDLDSALKAADRIVTLEVNASEWALFKGQVLCLQSRFREAIDQYTQATSTEPDAYLYRAHAYRRLREYDKAVDDYGNRLERPAAGPASMWELYQRATPLWILGRTEEALADYEKFRVLRGRPFYSDARRFLILREMNRLEEAEAVLAAALREVDNAWLRQIFRCLAGELSPDELVADGAGRDNQEQLCEAYYYAGEVCLFSGNLTKAHKWFQQCVETGVQFDLDNFLLTPMNEYELAQWRLESLPPEAAVPLSEEN